MKDLNQWLQAYGESHQHPKNKLIHWVCVPAILFSIIGLLWSLSPISTLVLMGLSLFFYYRLSLRLTIAMAVIFAFSLIISHLLADYLLISSLVIFFVAWLFQFIGHNIEGKKPSFFEDLQFLLIGPLWCLAFLFRKFRISY
ncbi:hypothetical protein ACH42_00380 [Endozoicomonas sp. (ex Bugula neritina AB1)]|nr:hypothetical protein ACH42_00380 [Endozoicomonas sp. (ex Bugula neritina AB1)]